MSQLRNSASCDARVGHPSDYLATSLRGPLAGSMLVSGRVFVKSVKGTAKDVRITHSLDEYSKTSFAQGIC